MIIFLHGPLMRLTLHFRRLRLQNMYRIVIPRIELFLCNRHRSIYFVVVLLFCFYFAQVCPDLVVAFGATEYVVDVGERRSVLALGIGMGGRDIRRRRSIRRYKVP
jgi:hypothetical protein